MQFDWRQVEESWWMIMQNWNVDLLNLNSFFDWVAPVERFLYGCYLDPTPERKVPGG